MHRTQSTFFRFRVNANSAPARLTPSLNRKKKSLLHLKSTTKFNSVGIVNHRNSKIWSLQKFFEEKAILHYFAAYWKVKEKEINKSLILIFTSNILK